MRNSNTIVPSCWWRRISAIVCGAAIVVAALAANVPAVVVLPVDLELVGNGIHYDDICFWRDPSDSDESLVFVTSKYGPAIDVLRLATGEFLASITDFEKPNNCDVDGDLLVTTDRGARKVVAHHIPDLSLVTVFGSGLSDPQGVSVLHHEGRALAYVTDKSRDVHVYDLATFELVRVFSSGFSSQEGIVADDLYERVYIANDSTGVIRAFTHDGIFIDEFEKGAVGNDAEGIALYKCGMGGWVLVSDQFAEKSASHYGVFDRITFDYVGKFSLQDADGDFTNGTDGIEIFQSATSRFPGGVFAACDDCSGPGDDVDVVGWERIASALGLAVCPEGVPPTCGDGILDNTEECDGDAAGSCPGLCSFDCRCGDALPRCGDDLVNRAEEECDGLDDAACVGFCRDDCLCSPECGDELPDGAPCDDGNPCSFDDRCVLGGCIGTPSCGNDFVDAACGEICDGLDRAACSGDCVAPGQPLECTCALPAVCGDNEINQPTEECDGSDSSGCPGVCQVNCTCGTPIGAIVADVSVLEKDPNKNFGTAALLDIDAQSPKQTFLRLALSGVGTRKILTARIELQVADTSNAESESGGRIHPLSECEWDELSVTWNARPSIETTVLDELGPVARGDLVTFDVRGAVSEDGTYCFALDSLSSDGVKYNTREAAAGHPRFLITTGGVPTASTSTSTTTSTTTTTSSMNVTSTTSPRTTTTTTSSTSLPATTTTTTTSTTLPPTTTTTTASTTTTTLPAGVCGDGLLNHPSEECDDQDTTACVAGCQVDCTCAPFGQVLADVSTSERDRNSNLGTDPLLNVDGDSMKHTFFRILVDNVGDRILTEAKLHLRVGDENSSASDLGGSIHRITDCSWDELSLTFNNEPVIDGPPLDALGPVEPGDAVELDLMAGIPGDGIFCFAMTSASSNGADYHSREATTGNPMLVLSATGAPESEGTTTTTTSVSSTTTTLPGTTVITEVLADARTEAGNPDQTFGTDTELSVDADSEKNTVIRVRVSGIGGRTVTSATIELTVVDAKSAPSDSGGRIERVTNCTWNENTVTFSNQPLLDGTPGPDVGPIARGDTVQFDVTAHVTADGTYCFAITSNSPNGADYNSRESATGQPVFRIETTP